MNLTQANRYNSSFCEVCGASAGSVYKGWIVCDNHFRRELPEERLFDVKTGEPLSPVVLLNEPSFGGNSD